MRKSLVIATALFYVKVQEILQVIHMLISMKVITVHVLKLDGISLGKHHLHVHHIVLNSYTPQILSDITNIFEEINDI